MMNNCTLEEAYLMQCGGDVYLEMSMAECMNNPFCREYGTLFFIAGVVKIPTGVSLIIALVSFRKRRQAKSKNSKSASGKPSSGRTGARGGRGGANTKLMLLLLSCCTLVLSSTSDVFLSAGVDSVPGSFKSTLAIVSWWYACAFGVAAMGVTAVVNRKVRGLVKSLTGTQLVAKPVSRVKQGQDAMKVTAAVLLVFTVGLLIVLFGPYPTPTFSYSLSCLMLGVGLTCPMVTQLYFDEKFRQEILAREKSTESNSVTGSRKTGNLAAKLNKKFKRRLISSIPIFLLGFLLVFMALSGILSSVVGVVAVVMISEMLAGLSGIALGLNDVLGRKKKRKVKPGDGTDTHTNAVSFRSSVASSADISTTKVNTFV